MIDYSLLQHIVENVLIPVPAFPALAFFFRERVDELRRLIGVLERTRCGVETVKQAL